MGAINYTRVFLGGLLAGVVLNILEALHGMLMAGQWQEFLSALGRPLEPTGSQMLVYPLLSLLVGIAAVWLYAVAQPRFGPGSRTAVYVGLAYGIVGYAIPGLAWGLMIGFPSSLLAIAIIWGILAVAVATVVGAWLYKE